MFRLLRTMLNNVLRPRDGRFGSKVGQIGSKWDKSGTFSDQFSGEPKCTENWYLKTSDLSHLVPIWPNSDGKFDIPGWEPRPAVRCVEALVMSSRSTYVARWRQANRCRQVKGPRVRQQASGPYIVQINKWRVTHNCQSTTHTTGPRQSVTGMVGLAPKWANLTQFGAKPTISGSKHGCHTGLKTVRIGYFSRNYNICYSVHFGLETIWLKKQTN